MRCVPNPLGNRHRASIFHYYELTWSVLYFYATLGKGRHLEVPSMVTAAMKLKDVTPWKESYDQPRQHIKKQRCYFANKVHLVKAMVFPVVTMDVRVGL